VRTGRPIATTVEPALDSATRKRGLLGRAGLAPGHALVIAPSNLIHTFFLRFSIDIVFARKAFAVVEMAAGTLAEPDLRVGDRLVLSQD
jgi:uncharacterized membrane protein (UPF0127 family)